MISLPEIRSAIGGRIEGSQVRAPGPGRGPKDRSISVRLSAQSPDGFICHSHSSSFDWREVRDYVAGALGLSDDRWRGAREIDPIEAMRRRVIVRREEERAAADAAQRAKRARELFQHAVDPHATLAETYLTGRAIALDDIAAGNAIRFHGACPFDGERLPCMVAAMRGIESDEIQAVHRTALTPQGTKLDRMMLGPAGGTAIKLDPHNAVTDELVIGEGVESGMAARILGHGPTWALGSVGGIRSFPVLAGVRRLTILCERNDGGANEAAGRACAARWHDAERKVRFLWPRIGDDMADVLREDRR